jgi:hypothetical protein
MLVRENNQNGRKFIVSTASCYLHRRSSSLCNLRFRKSFVLKNIPNEGVNFRTGKPAFLFAGKAVVCVGVLTAQGMSHTVVAVPGCLGTQASYARFTYVVSDPLTDLSRGWSLWVQCGAKMRTATHFSIACMDKCKSWFSSNRNTGLSFEGLACAMKCFTYLTKDPPSSA